MAKGKKTGGRQAGTPNKPKAHSSLKEELAEIKSTLPVPIPPKRLVDLDDKDAAAQADHIMQFAGRMMRKAQALLEDPPENVSPTAVRDEFMQWMNVVMRAAGMLLPYQRPTYRSIEVRTDRGLEERQTRYIGDPAERLAQIVVGAIRAQPDATIAPSGATNGAKNATSDAPDGAEAPPEPVDNGDGVIS
jgi:hypothetical protein